MFPEVQMPCAAPAVLPEMSTRPAVIPFPRRPTRARECRVCLGQHDPTTHDATVSVHDWFRDHVLRNLTD
jgi:hypothetical protein